MTKLAGKRVLITGAAGFVGACLTRALIEDEAQVHVLLRPQSNLWRLHDIRHRLRPHFVDLRDAAAVKETVATIRPDVVFHAAANGVYPSQQDRLAILSSNILGTANLLDALQPHDNCIIVNLGSVSEYGNYDRSMSENDLLQPRTVYGVSKAAATLLCQSEAYRGRAIVTVRLFSTYGPWEDPTRLVPYVMDCCRRGESPRVSDGRQYRDFIYIADVINLLRIVAVSPHLRGMILHAGTGSHDTVREMIETIIAVCGNRVTAQFGAIANRPDESPVFVADINHTIELTGWRPQYSMRAGIEAMWAWHTRSHAA